jgi:hypothetical protein
MSIEALALEVLSLKKAASEALAQGDTDAFMLASSMEIQKQRQLRLEVTTHNFIEVESKAAKDLLRKIRSEVSEEEQAMAEILKQIEDEGTSGLLIEDAGDIDDLTGKLLYSWFSDREYVLGLFRSGAVVIRCRVPYELKNLVEEARQCFAFQQHNAVISLCRTILESAVTDIGVRTGLIPKSALTRRDFYKQYPPWERIDAVSREPLRTQMHNFYDVASAVIHGRTSAGIVSALEALKSTLTMVETLYSQHGHAITTAECNAPQTPSH